MIKSRARHKAEKILKKCCFENNRTPSIVAEVANRGRRCYAASVSQLLFSYGTLRQRDVQLATFGRELEGYVDAIIGYDLDYVTITDPHVIATSGSDRHPILRPTDRAGAHVDGTVFTISDAELAAADDYEVDDYRRISVPLRSGPRAWVYVFAG
jgi:Gamma-glutamyl cyclotransferase, AIG2-like